jgi:hypothetical protein
VIWSPHTGTTGLWWYFYIDGSTPSSLRASSSADFKGWSTAAPLGMPSASTSRGTSFSVDVYSPSGGTDIAEIAIGLEGTTSNPTQLYHFRAQLQGSTTATFDTPYASILSDTTGAMTYNDHVSIAASDNGYLAIASGLWPSGGDVWTALLTTSSETDQQGWVPTWGKADNLSSSNTLSRQVVSLGGGNFMTLADDVGTGTPQTLDYAVGTGSNTPWTPSSIPFASVDQDTNGWSAAASGSNVHVVRHTSAGYDYAVYSGGSWSVTANTPDTTTSPVADSGVLTAVDGATVVAVVIDQGTGHIWAASSDKGWAWKDEMIGGNPASLQGLSGYSVAVNHKVAITWTDTSGSSPTLMGALICVP